MDIDLHLDQNHHKAFQNKGCSHTDTSPVGDSNPFGWETNYILSFEADWYKAWYILLVLKD